ncbi:hypothetical protein O1L60_24250 [Streptomyces diastatochromogenes]|nr:hypothetical protein [Streptomyces diastatochromogenes]
MLKPWVGFPPFQVIRRPCARRFFVWWTVTSSPEKSSYGPWSRAW